MKIYLSLSFVLNLILAAVYFNFNYIEKYFHRFESVENTMHLSVDLLAKENKEYIKEIQKLSRKKPRIQAPFNIFFDCSEEIVNQLNNKIENLLQCKFISDENLQEIVAELAVTKQELKSNLRKTFSNESVMRETKLRQRDIDKEIDAIKSYYDSPSFEKYNLEHLSTKEKKLILSSIMLHLQNINRLSIHKIGSLIGGCSLGSRKYFPVISTNKSIAKVNEPFKIQIYPGAYSSELTERSAVLWDGKKLNSKDGIYDLKQEATSSGGYQKHEIVLLWVDENDIVRSDTTHYEFYVNH